MLIVFFSRGERGICGLGLVNGLGVCSAVLVGGRGYFSRPWLEKGFIAFSVFFFFFFFFFCVYELRLLGEPRSLKYLDNCQFLQSYSSF